MKHHLYQRPVMSSFASIDLPHAVPVIKYALLEDFGFVPINVNKERQTHERN